MVIPRRTDLVERLWDLQAGLLQGIENRIQMAKEGWRGLVKRLTDPRRKLRDHQQRLDEVSVDLFRGLQGRLRQLKERLAIETGRLDALSPLAVLERGYSITYKLPDEKIVKDADSVELGDRVRVSFAHGKAICRVEGKERHETAARQRNHGVDALAISRRPLRVAGGAAS
jgi:exodeoxyribonuclease VII large subunit